LLTTVEDTLLSSQLHTKEPQKTCIEITTHD